MFLSGDVFLHINNKELRGCFNYFMINDFLKDFLLFRKTFIK